MCLDIGECALCLEGLQISSTLRDDRIFSLKYLNTSSTESQDSSSFHSSFTCIERDEEGPAVLRRKHIGGGGFSEVFRAYLRRPGHSCHEVVALKTLRGVSSRTKRASVDTMFKHMKREMGTWSRLEHPNIAALRGYNIENAYGMLSISLVLDWYPHGNVSEFLANYPHANRKRLCLDIALGLAYLHDLDPQIIHGDVKGDNVLIGEDGRALLCDFGLSIILDGLPTGHTSSTFAATTAYLAPEIAISHRRTPQADVYAYGCTCLEVLYDQKPYERYDRNVILISQAILKHESPHEWPDGPCPLDLFMSQCWAPDPSNRPTMNEVCAMFGSVLQEEDEEDTIIIAERPPKLDNSNRREFEHVPESNPPCGAASRVEEPCGPGSDPA
ncbi:hypothetical protein BS47DRAFT_778929 [Hydnum rufescens UP504]|uniref:Protein kinase domain-containing protein n=1 Tax=Hydnum rufescens UP504 TaxID=1448309 RepID=A0A9P6B0L0_9AGAM|nr:hypothetical protein BS47DRAFT_778929 [Hydnum rufescens UP504]